MTDTVVWTESLLDHRTNEYCEVEFDAWYWISFDGSVEITSVKACHTSQEDNIDDAIASQWEEEFFHRVARRNHPIYQVIEQQHHAT